MRTPTERLLLSSRRARLGSGFTLVAPAVITRDSPNELLVGGGAGSAVLVRRARLLDAALVAGQRLGVVRIDILFKTLVAGHDVDVPMPLRIETISETSPARDGR